MILLPPLSKRVKPKGESLTNKNQFLHPLVGAIISRITMVTNDIKMPKQSKLQNAYRLLQPCLVV